MKPLFKLGIGIFLTVLVTGCAGSYHPITPNRLKYSAHDVKDGIEFSYKYDVLRERGNKKYAKKEEKKAVKLVAVKIRNTTGTVIKVGENANFFSGERIIYPMEPALVKNTIKQIVPGYLPYMLLSFLNVYTSNGTTTNVYRVGLIVGPAITVGNMVGASSANKKLLMELEEYNVVGREILPGETVHGIIGIRDTEYNPLSLRLNTVKPASEN